MKTAVKAVLERDVEKRDVDVTVQGAEIQPLQDGEQVVWPCQHPECEALPPTQGFRSCEWWQARAPCLHPQADGLHFGLKIYRK